MLANESEYERVNVPSGELLFKKGEDADYIYLLEYGHVAVFNISSQNRLIPMFSKTDHGIIGEDSVLQEKPIYKNNAVALKDSSLIKIPTAEIHLFLSSSANWLENIMFELSGKVTNTAEIVLGHNIIDERLNDSVSFTDEELKRLRDSIKD